MLNFIFGSVEFESSVVLSDLQEDFQIQLDMYGYLGYRDGQFLKTNNKSYGIASFDVEPGQMLEISSKTDWNMGIIAYDENGRFVDSWHHDTLNKDLFNFIPDKWYDPKTSWVTGLRIIIPETARKFSISHMTLFNADGSLN